jgi:hypothetical protein
MRVILGAALALATVGRGALAQNEAALRAAFEGKTIAVRMDMPATSRGVDVYPQDGMPVNFREVAERLKDNGTSLKIGQQVMITKVVVKKSSHIEFQLGGGGYGTFGDYMSNSSEVSAVSAGESKEEKALRDSIKHAPGPTKRKQFERELANVRDSRERENARAKAEAAQANEAREANLRVKRAESGSRFNVRYRNGIPPEGLTPEGVMKALAQYVDFSAMGGPSAVASNGSVVLPVGATQSLASSSSASAAPKAGLSALKKGLTLKDVEALLGPASTANELKEGSMTVMKRTYKHEGMKVEAKFVSDVLIDFSITPEG